MPSEVELDGSSDEHLITFAMCRDHGLRLVGPPAKEVFSPVQTSLVIQALRNVLSWHKNHLLDPFHDPRGTNSVLNACRAWCYVETERLVSKSAGAKWVLEQHPNNRLVKAALLNRQGQCASDQDPEAIGAFLNRVIRVCDANLP